MPDVKIMGIGQARCHRVSRPWPAAKDGGASASAATSSGRRSFSGLKTDEGIRVALQIASPSPYMIDDTASRWDGGGTSQKRTSERLQAWDLELKRG